MKIKNYLVVALFVALIMFATLQQKRLESDIIEKVNNYEVETLNNLYNLTDIMIDYKNEKLKEISNFQFSDSDISNLKEQIENYTKEKGSLDFYSDYVLMFENGNIITTLAKKNDGSYFGEDEKIEIENLYKKIKHILSFAYADCFVKSDDAYSLYFGGPLFDSNGQFIGIIATNFKSNNFDRLLTNIIGDAHFEFSMTQNGNEIYNNKIKIKKYAQERLNAICENEIYISKLNAVYKLKYNIYDGNKILYLPLSLTYLFAILFTGYMLIVFRKHKIDVPFKQVAIIMLVAVIIFITNIFIHKNYRDYVTKISEYACSHIIYESIAYNRDKYTMICSTFSESVQKMVDQSPGLNSSNYKEFVDTKLLDQFDLILNNTSGLGHIYVYGKDKSVQMYPQNEKDDYIAPKDEPFINFKGHAGSYVDIEYTDNYQSNMLFIVYPILKNDDLLFNLTYVYDFDYIRDRLFKSISNTSMDFVYIDENYNQYLINDGKMEYSKKYGSLIDVFNVNKWTDSTKDKIYYGLFYDGDKTNEYETIYSHYINGLVYVKDTNKMKITEIIDEILIVANVSLVLFLGLGFYSYKKYKNETNK